MTRLDPAVDLARLGAFLFDLDGTLIRQCIDFGEMRRLVVEVLRGFGADGEALVARHVLEMIDLAAADVAARDGARATLLRAEADRTIVDLEVEAAERATPLDGVVELLGGLRARGMRVGIVTRNCRAAVERVLARHTLAHDVLLTRDDVAYVKPDPRHLTVALDLLGVPSRRAAMCGDHPMDVLAGRRAGTAATVGVLPQGRDASYFEEVRPDLVLRGVAELGSYLGL